MPLDVAGTGTVLLVGGGETAQGEAWLENNTGGDVKIEKAELSIQVAAVEQTGQIPLPPDETIADKSFRRLSISFGMEPFTAPGQYAAHLDLTTSIGVQVIPASLVVLTNEQVAVLPEQPVFTGVVPPSTITTAVIVRNVGNASVTVDSIADEPLFEVVAGQRLLGVGAGGVVQVQPASSLRCAPARPHVHARGNTDDRPGRVGQDRDRHRGSCRPGHRVCTSAPCHGSSTIGSVSTW